MIQNIKKKCALIWVSVWIGHWYIYCSFSLYTWNSLLDYCRFIILLFLSIKCQSSFQQSINFFRSFSTLSYILVGVFVTLWFFLWNLFSVTFFKFFTYKTCPARSNSFPTKKCILSLSYNFYRFSLVLLSS